METRKQLYSRLVDESGEERLYSTTEFVLEDLDEENQKLFSTGDSELDDILEEVYYSGIEDGYDYAQREFSEEEHNGGAGTAAAGAGVATAGVGGGALLTRRGKKKALENAKKEMRAIKETAEKNIEKVQEGVAKQKANLSAAHKEKAGKLLDEAASVRKPWEERDLFDRISGRRKEKLARKTAKKEIETRSRKLEGSFKKIDKNLAEATNRINETAANATKGVKEKARQNIKKLSRKGKIIGGAGLAAGGIITASGALKNRNNNER